LVLGYGKRIRELGRVFSCLPQLEEEQTFQKKQISPNAVAAVPKVSPTIFHSSPLCRSSLDTDCIPLDIDAIIKERCDLSRMLTRAIDVHQRGGIITSPSRSRRS
jgi:hypothetical protein